MSAASILEAAATASLPPLPPAKEIPSSFTASFRSWWNVGEKEAQLAEERLLRRLPYFRPSASPPSTPSAGPVTATSRRVPLLTPKHYLNTLSITSTSPSPTAPAPAVLLHGYGAGLGFFFQNLPPLAAWAARRHTSVYALDWLGMGRSARVPFTVKARRADTDARVAEAEAFFIDALEQWRVRMGLERMQLVGHSLGGYLSVAYALKYPSRVERLVLLSPAGVPRDPDSTEEPSRELTESQTADQELPDAGSGAPSGSGLAARFGAKRAAGTAEPASPPRVEKIKAEQRAEKQKETKMRKVFTYLWEEGFSPFQLVRSSLFWGPLLVGKYSSRRFSGLTEEETRDMHEYILNITLAKGSGEYCISHILAPGAHARRPLVDRVAALKIPVTFVYGDHDWMDPEGGSQSVANLKKAGNTEGRMYVVPYAGHHVYLDNAKAVNELLVKELDRPVVRAP
ncbi:alpha/beta-hydrolase [Punctularia strigosozonata HHB-11173 SS5]|uniref:alpha/beta-hydrolase n=1 Tax=Punctularia strigosozonata (strain HHB-11173) TaxID=741275 RepID=UPI0004416D2F|nr:alpha/beta-hydrolase [Punctularia strigosozonata HHB-11173 SS5]EIN10302.1 alpha/beta-hydrolase [Punctularia strigosozonata HHB-11173 SS5]